MQSMSSCNASCPKAVLVAVAIPTFTAQLEKSREGVDAANIRSAYAEVLAARMGSGSVEYYKDAGEVKQTKAGWVTSNDWPTNLYTDNTCATTLKADAGSTFKPATTTTPATHVYVVSAGEGKAYVTTTAPTASATLVDVDTLG